MGDLIDLAAARIKRTTRREIVAAYREALEDWCGPWLACETVAARFQIDPDRVRCTVIEAGLAWI
jgi:hypothetical protein